MVVGRQLADGRHDRIGQQTIVRGHVRESLDLAYDVFAKRRTGASVELGLAACGAPPADDAPRALPPLPPSTARRFAATGLVREVLGGVVVLSMLHASTHHGDVGFKTPDSPALEAMSWWLRTPARWDIMAPEPPATTEKLVSTHSPATSAASIC